MSSIGDRRLRQLEEVDELPPGVKPLVYEFGYPIVRAMAQCGVTDPRHIRELVHQCWCGAREGSQRKGTFNKIDWLLAQSGSRLSAATLAATLRQSGTLLVPLEPSPQMVEASMAEVQNHGPLRKYEKHRLRLRAANLAAASHIWGIT
jgi:hypothetical protein